MGQVQQNLSATRLQLAGYLAALPEASRQRLSQTDLPRWLTEWSKEFGVAGIQSAEILKPATTPADLAQAVKHYVVLRGLQHHWLTGAAMPAPLAAVSRGPPTGKDAAALDRDLRRTQLGIAELVRELGPAALQLIPGWVAQDQARLGVEGVTAADVTAAVRRKARPTPQPAPLPTETALTAPHVLRPPVALAPPPLAPAAPVGLPAADAGWPRSVPTTPEPALTMSAVEERLQALVTERLDEARRAFTRTLWSA